MVPVSARSRLVPPDNRGPATHYELFAALRDAGVACLVSGAAALTLHGVPRLTPEIELLVDPEPANLARLGQFLTARGYGRTGAAASVAAGAAVHHYRNPSTALEQIDVVLPPAAGYAALQAGATSVPLIDVGIPLVGAADLRAIRLNAGSVSGREDAAGLETLASIRAGEQGSDTDTGREQIRKFSRWSIAARLDWLLAAARLSKGLSPEARTMTRGLVRRRGWYGR